MTDPEDIHVSVPLEEGEQNEVQERLETEQTALIDRLKLYWKSFSIVILTGLTLTLLIVTFIMLIYLNMLIQEEMGLQVEIKELRTALNASEVKYNFLDRENERCQDLVRIEQNSSMQLRDENKRQRSILFSNKLSFLWEFCDKQTLLCSPCIPGWTEHSTRCFHVSAPKKWQNARQDCLSNGGDLAVVVNPEDQAFLTNLTFHYGQQHPSENVLAAWIGLEDMVKEDRFRWVNGGGLQTGVDYWRKNQPDNVVASWDAEGAGQDCVAVVPPNSTEGEDWLESWDDISCLNSYHYVCETKMLILN